MFTKRDRSMLDILYSKLNENEWKDEYNQRSIQIQQEVIRHQKEIIDSLLNVLCEKHTDQTLIIGFGKNIHPIVVQNGDRVTEDKLKSVHYEWVNGNTESIHIEYENN